MTQNTKRSAKVTNQEIEQHNLKLKMPRQIRMQNTGKIITNMYTRNQVYMYIHVHTNNYLKHQTSCINIKKYNVISLTNLTGKKT